MAAVRLFPLEGSRRHDPAVERWFGAQRPELGAIARTWFEAMRACGPDVGGLLHDGHPTACVADLAFGYVDAFRSHVNVGFFLGTSLEDPAGLLEGSGRFMRHVKVRPGTAIDADALRALIVAAYADMKGRAAAEVLQSTPTGHCRTSPAGVATMITSRDPGAASMPGNSRSAMEVLPVRLSPGDDLRAALQAQLAARSCDAGFVISGIGSLSVAQLRLAGASGLETIRGDLEILTLAGTLATDHPHLHMSISDGAGRLLGGHVGPGCVVRTTAEVLLALLPDWKFTRQTDTRTGFAELAISHRGSNEV